MSGWSGLSHQAWLRSFRRASVEAMLAPPLRPFSQLRSGYEGNHVLEAASAREHCLRLVDRVARDETANGVREKRHELLEPMDRALEVGAPGVDGAQDALILEDDLPHPATE